MIIIFMIMRKKNYSVKEDNKIYKIGDSVKIRVANVSIAKAEIDFVLI